MIARPGGKERQSYIYRYRISLKKLLRPPLLLMFIIAGLCVCVYIYLNRVPIFPQQEARSAALHPLARATLCAIG